MLLLLVLPLIEAKDAKSCFKIESNVCDAFNGTLIDSRVLTNIYGNQKLDQDVLQQSNTSSEFNFISQNLQKVGCKPRDFPIRYLRSVWCSFNVYASSQTCQSNQARPQLCKSTCDDFLASVSAVLRENTSCPYLDPYVASSLMTNISVICSGQSYVSGCIKWTSQDQSTCGFGRQQDALDKYCNSQQPSDPCCKLSNVSKAPATSLTAEATAVLLPKFTESAVFNPSGYIEQPSNAMNWTIIAAIGSVVAFMILLALTAYFYYKRKKGKQSPTMSIYTQETVNEFPPVKEMIQSQEDYQPIEYEYAGIQIPHTPLFHESYPRCTRWQAVIFYRAQNYDEIGLEIGDSLFAGVLYLDGYCFAMNESTGWVGNVPLGCIQPADLPASINQQYRELETCRDQTHIAYQQQISTRN